jgi:hypothetical protein
VTKQDRAQAGEGWMFYLTAMVAICTVAFIALALGFHFELVSAAPVVAIGAGALGLGVGVLVTRVSLLARQPKPREVTFLRLGLGGLVLAIVLLLTGTFTPFSPRPLSSHSASAATTGASSAPAPSATPSATASPPATGFPSPPPVSSEPSASPVAIRFRGPLTLTNGGPGASLDSLPNPSQPPDDLLLSNGGTQIAGQELNSLALWTGSQPPMAQDCAKEVATQSRSTVPTGVGTQFCVRTATGRWAYLKVTGHDSQTVLLDVEVWEKTS